MKTIPIQLQTHLKQAATTTCLLLKIECRNGNNYGLTTLDQNIEYDDIGDPNEYNQLTYYASNGVAPGRLQSAADFGIDNTDLSGVTSLEDGYTLSDELTASDVLAGVLDYATVRIYRVNYLDLSQGHELIMVGTCGQTEINGRQFRCEFRSLMQQARQTISTVYSLTCRADYGSPECGKTHVWHNAYIKQIDLQRPQQVLHLGGNGVTSFPPGYFDYGVVSYSPWGSAAEEVEIEKHGADGKITLALPLKSVPPLSYSYIRIRQDCDKTIATCRARNNTINFRGEHLTPIADTTVYAGIETKGPETKSSGGLLAKALPFIGAIVGSFVGMPNIGFMIGSALSGVGTRTHTTGPRLGDARAQTSTVGGVIPFGYGKMVVAGNIIWRTALREKSHTTKKKIMGGLGGKQKTTTYHYYRDYAIGICQGPIHELLWIKRDGKKVWPLTVKMPNPSPPRKYKNHGIGKRKTSMYKTWEREWSKYRSQWAYNRLTIYYGTENQTRDPLMVEREGEHISAYRGLAYIVVKNDDLTASSGAIAQFEFCINTRADAPLLPDVVKDIYRRSGVSADNIDIGQLPDKPIIGYNVAVEAGADTLLEPLQQAYFFDPAEWDGQLRAVPRGRQPPVVHIPADALLARDAGPLTITRVQEAELLRAVNITALDSAIDLLPNTQTASRRSTLIKARGQASFELPLVLTATEQKSIAQRMLKVAWGELHRFEFALPLAWSFLTPTDVVTLSAPYKRVADDPYWGEPDNPKEARIWRMRIESIEEEAGRLLIRAVEEAPWAHEDEGATVPLPPDSGAPDDDDTAGAPGLSEAVLLNIPLLHNAEPDEDALGYYLAVMGSGSGWHGAMVEFSLDGGAHLSQTLDVVSNSLIGEVTTDIADDAASITVLLPTPWTQLGSRKPQSTDAAGLANFANQAAIERADGTWEVIQFETVTPAGLDKIVLSDLVRGGYDTAVLPLPEEATIVFLSDAVQFFPLAPEYIGATVHLRAFSHDGDADPAEVDWDELEPPASLESQREWAVKNLTVTRDPDTDDVTLTWEARPRLGLASSPYHSQHHTGYLLQWSDDEEETLTDPATTTHTRPATPLDVTVTITPINALTGHGSPVVSITV